MFRIFKCNCEEKKDVVEIDLWKSRLIFIFNEVRSVIKKCMIAPECFYEILSNESIEYGWPSGYRPFFFEVIINKQISQDLTDALTNYIFKNINTALDEFDNRNYKYPPNQATASMVFINVLTKKEDSTILKIQEKLKKEKEGRKERMLKENDDLINCFEQLLKD